MVLGCAGVVCARMRRGPLAAKARKQATRETSIMPYILSPGGASSEKSRHCMRRKYDPARDRRGHCGNRREPGKPFSVTSLCPNPANSLRKETIPSMLSYPCERHSERTNRTNRVRSCKLGSFRQHGYPSFQAANSPLPGCVPYGCPHPGHLRHKRGGATPANCPKMGFGFVPQFTRAGPGPPDFTRHFQRGVLPFRRNCLHRRARPTSEN